jgi:hypothetical protein
LHKGEIITFRVAYGTQGIVTHRIRSISKKGIIRTKGDANPSPDAWFFGRGNVLGTQLRTVPDLGYAIVFLKQPAGIAAVVTGFLSILLLWSMFFPATETRSSKLEADPDRVVIDIRTDAEKAADAILAGIPRLRGRHRAPGTSPAAVQALRTGGCHRGLEPVRMAHRRVELLTN